MKKVIIRKYKNRRLYDTERSEYITREELMSMIREGRTVEIQEVGSEENVTVETLFQFMVTDSKDALRTMPPEFVHFLIRSKKGVLTQFFRGFFPFALKNFTSTLQSMTGMPQGGVFPGMNMQNPWQNFMGPFQNMGWTPFGMQGGQPDGAGSQEVEELKKQLEALQKELEDYKGKE